MRTLLVKWLVSALAILFVGNFLPGIHVPDFTIALIVALVLGIMNAVIRPILLIITLPINILTLGIFTFILNGFMLWLVDFFLVGIVIDGFWWAVIGAVVISLLTMIGNWLILGSDGKWGNDSDK